MVKQTKLKVPLAHCTQNTINIFIYVFITHTKVVVVVHGCEDGKASKKSLFYLFIYLLDVLGSLN